MLDDVKLAELSNNSFEWKNVTYYRVKTYSAPPTYFHGVITQPRGSTLLHQALLHPTFIVCVVPAQWVTCHFGNLSFVLLTYLLTYCRKHEQCQQAVQKAATICSAPCDLDLWPLDLESGVRVTCDVGYLCANLSLPVGFSVLDLVPMYATDSQRDVRGASSLNAPA